MMRIPPKPIRTARKPLWRGPYVDGITNSLLAKFLQCRDRFWHRVVLGLVPDEGFNYAIEFGSLWHECEEAHAAKADWLKPLKRYRDRLYEKYPAEQSEVTKWYVLCGKLFPHYIAHYQNHPSVIGRVPHYQEKAFRVGYRLQDGRLVIIRGKFDSVYYKKTASGRSYWLQENKTKGEIDAEMLRLTLKHNCQTMIYLTALHQHLPSPEITGTCYNVIRRPLSSRHSPKQKKKESDEAFYKRAITALFNEPTEQPFYRWSEPISLKQIRTFQQQSLNPLLKQVCDWWDSIQANPFDPWQSPLHFRTPFGTYDPMQRGYRGDYFDLLATDSKAGLVTTKTLFPELEPHATAAT